MKRLLRSEWLAARIEVVLGCVFIYASFHKIMDPPDFAHMVYNYKMTPGPLINLIAIYLPWIEAVAGAALVLGLKGRKGGAAIVGAMLLVFIAAIGFNLLRGNIIECGCLEGSDPNQTPAQLLWGMWETLGRDVLMVLGVAQVLIAGKAAERRSLAPENFGEEVGAPA